MRILNPVGFPVLERFDFIIVHLQKDSCSRGAENKRTRAGLQEKVKQSVAFPPCPRTVPPFWRGLIVQHDRLIRFKIGFFKRATRCLCSRKPLSSPRVTIIPKFRDLTRFLDLYAASIVVNTHAKIRTTTLEFDGVRGSVSICLRVYNDFVELTSYCHRNKLIEYTLVELILARDDFDSCSLITKTLAWFLNSPSIDHQRVALLIDCAKKQ